MNEIWKDIPEYEGLYQVSNMARVKSLARFRKHSRNATARVNERILKPGIDTCGYYGVGLCNGSSRKTFLIHRLVAHAFIPNPDSKPCINHKDGNKTNNHISNLEWCTQSENIRHAYENGLSSGVGGADHWMSKCIIDLETGITYGCIKDAAVAGGVNYGTLRAMLSGRTPNKTTFRYLESL